MIHVGGDCYHTIYLNCKTDFFFLILKAFWRDFFMYANFIKRCDGNRPLRIFEEIND